MPDPYSASGYMRKVGDYMKKIPHVKIPNVDETNPYDKPIFTPEEEKRIRRIRKWALIICIASVVGYALYRLFFG